MPRSAVRVCLWVALFGVSQMGVAQSPVARIINGEPTDDYPAVGIVSTERTGGFCTGTLISPSHVLTSGHCAELVEDDGLGTFELGGQTYNVVGVDIHPAFDVITLANDIAVLKLAEPVSTVEPAEIFRGEPLVGDELTIVGYGSGGTAEGGADGNFGVKMVGSTVVDDVDELFVYWDFDDPSESNTAPGDSGGPGFIEVAGQLYIAAVISGGSKQDASLGDHAFNTRVDTYAAWIDAITMVDFTDDDPADDDPSDGEPDDDEPDDETPDEGSPCSDRPVQQALRQVLAEILKFLASDSFISFLQELVEEWRAEDR